VSTPLESASSLQASSGLPLANQALEPAAVRNGSAATKKAYEAALDFEQMLVQQLSQSMLATSGLEGSGEGGSEAEGSSSSSSSESSAGESLPGFAGGGNSELSSLLPQSLTEGVMSQGGLGIAQQLMTQLDPASATSATSTSSATSTTAAGKVVPAGGVAA
jgi:Rod binding domain-containing protein